MLSGRSAYARGSGRGYPYKRNSNTPPFASKIRSKAVWPRLFFISNMESVHFSEVRPGLHALFYIILF
jgi:hypothetical protein